MDSSKITKETLKSLNIQYETHLFTCIKYLNTPDSGFTNNLYLFLEAVQQSDKVKDEDLKIMAKGILASVTNHKIVLHDMEKMNENLLKYREEKEQEEKDKTENLKAELAL
jgi:hypothetical protein